MVTEPTKLGNTIAPLPKNPPSGDAFRPFSEAELKIATSGKQVIVAPFDGWGYVENIDGELALPFAVQDIESGVFVDSGLPGWRGRIDQPDHKYDGMSVTMTPRHLEETSVVVLTVLNGNDLIFSGMADTEGRARNWK